MTIFPLLMLLLGIPAAVFACIQIYKARTTPAPTSTPRKSKPITQKKTHTLTWTSEIVVGGGK
jgi:hypothetical protein